MTVTTLRIKSTYLNFEKHRLEKKDKSRYGDEFYWTTAWFSVDLYLDEFENEIRTIESIVKNITILLRSDTHPWEFSIEKGNKIKVLYSWHSFRKEKSEGLYIDIASIIEEKLKASENPLELSIASRPYAAVHFYDKNEEIDDIFKQFHKYIKESIKKDTGIENFTRRKNTLPLLLESGEIQEGDLLKLKHNVKIGSDIDTKVISATLVKDKTKVKLKWHYDNEEYYISNLTEKIFKDFNITPIIKGKNGNLFWSLPNSYINLHAKAQRVHMINNSVFNEGGLFSFKGSI